jgi:ABC-type polysaccharide/polyol phosphate transport system ATPase subunit
VQMMSETIRARATDTTFVLTDHDYWSVRQVCTGLLSLDGGRLRRIGSADSDLRRAGYLPEEPSGSGSGR